MTTQMKVLNLVQGSSEWKAIRGEYAVASEAPVIMGASPHTKRDELLHMKKTGDEKEVNAWVERFVFSKGHETEALARPIAEERLGEELYPITGTREVEGLNLLASFDGITAPMYDDTFEHKQFNQALFDLVQSGGELEGKHYWQLEHQMLVAGTESCIFAVSDGTEENYAEMRYHSRPERREQLIEGWKLFIADLEAYEPRAPEQQLVAAPQTQLPTVSVRLDGKIAVISNLHKFGQALTDYVDNLNLVPETDQEFADLEAACKNLKEAETALSSAEERALAEIDEVEQMRRAVAQYREVARQARLAGEKAVKAQKQVVKLKIATEAKAQFDEHIATLNKALGGNYMPATPTDFNGAMKNKRTIDSLRAAANDESARARIEANRIAAVIEKNLEVLKTVAADHRFLFRDELQLVQANATEALTAIVKQRVRDHEEAERKREEQIRADEKAKVEREAAEKARLAEEQRKAEEAKAQAAEKARQDAAEAKRLEDLKLEQEKARQQEEEALAAQAEDTRKAQEAEAASHGAYTTDASPSLSPGLGQVGATRALDTRALTAKRNCSNGRPTDQEIIKVLACHYRVHESNVIQWILDMDLNEASEQVAANL